MANAVVSAARYLQPGQRVVTEIEALERLDDLVVAEIRALG